MWYLACWNSRTALDVEGSIETARQGRTVTDIDERKINLSSPVWAEVLIRSCGRGLEWEQR